MKKLALMILILGMVVALSAQKKPEIFGVYLFQDCQELEKTDAYKKLELEKVGGMPFAKKYYSDSVTINGIEIGKISVFVGKNEKNKMKRMEAEQIGHELPYKPEEDPFLKSSEGYVVLGMEFAFRPSKWKEILEILKKNFGKPKEESIRINDKIKSSNIDAKWALEDGATLRLQAFSVLGTASVYYKSNW